MEAFLENLILLPIPHDVILANGRCHLIGIVSVPLERVYVFNHAEYPLVKLYPLLLELNANGVYPTRLFLNNEGTPIHIPVLDCFMFLERLEMEVVQLRKDYFDYFN